jgi:DNA-binding transcriptional MerR regulator
MYSVKQAAEILNVTPRAIQLKCKKFKVGKIENEFQISEELINLWKQSKEAKTNEVELTPKTSQRSVKFASHNIPPKTPLFIVPLLLIIALIVSVLLYFNLTEQIEVSHLELKETKKAHYNEIKTLNKKLDDARDVIQNQELEIQALKYKDTIRRFIKN